MRAPQSEERSMRNSQSGERPLKVPQYEERSMRGPQSIVIPPSVEEISTLTPQKKRKTRSQSLVSSPIPQLDGNNKHANSESEIEPDPEPETQPNPNPGDSEKYDTESELSPASESDPLPPSNMDNPMFGYCEDKKCRLCPVKSTEKVGNYYSCFTNSLIKCCCQAIHWHSKTKICLTYNDIQNL